MSVADGNGTELPSPAEHPRGERIDSDVEGGALLSDVGGQLIGGLFIVETFDRGTPKRSRIRRRTVGRGDARTLVSRWRFGQALSEGDGR